MATFHGNWGAETLEFKRQLEADQRRAMAEYEAYVQSLRNASAAGGPIIEGEYVDVTGQKRLSNQGEKE